MFQAAGGTNMGLDEAKPGSDCWLSLQTLLNPQKKEVTEHSSHLPSYKFFLSSDLLKRDTRSMVKGKEKFFHSDLLHLFFFN